MSKEHSFKGEFRQVTALEKFKVHEDTLHARAGDHVFEGPGVTFVVSHEVYEEHFAPKKSSSKSK